ASIPSGSYTETQFVSLSNNTDATIYYTVDGTDPTTSSAVYEGAINVSNDMTIRAVAEKDGVMGQVSVYRYTISIFQVENTEPTLLQLFDYEEGMYSFSGQGASGEVVYDEERDSNVLEYRVSESSSPEI